MDEERPVRLVDLPTTIKGYCYHDDDGEEYVVLNARLSWEQNRKTRLHEQNHINQGHTFNQSYNEYN